MKIISSVVEMQAISQKWDKSLVIGFVPTMGYLHEGHLSLIRAAKQKCDIVVVSIYVNPSQFGANEDLSKYPRDAQRDFELMRPYEVDYVFFPTDEMMYPAPYKTWIDVQDISGILCGKSRPGHFRGVATIVLKLVNIVYPTYMFMGEKDFQQVAVLSKMLKDLNHTTQIVSCPIIREEDGLALSSRNVYLDEGERKRALCLSMALARARQMYADGVSDISIVRMAMEDIFHKAGAKIDYIAFVDSESLAEAEILDEHTRIIIAVFVGKTRLIDNSSVLA